MARPPIEQLQLEAQHNINYWLHIAEFPYRIATDVQRVLDGPGYWPTKVLDLTLWIEHLECLLREHGVLLEEVVGGEHPVVSHDLACGPRVAYCQEAQETPQGHDRRKANETRCEDKRVLVDCGRDARDAGRWDEGLHATTLDWHSRDDRLGRVHGVEGPCQGV